jgi:tetratricopeptide (TPR) repeat protein
MVETTASLAALRKYTAGQHLVLAGKRTEAIRRFEEAVAIDSAFASAWVGLGMAYGSMADVGRSAEAGRRAIRHQHRLPFIERSFLVASYSHGRQDYDTAIEVYRRLLDRYPDNNRALNNLALIHQEKRQFATAESLFIRAAAIDSTIANFYFGMAGNQMLQGKFDEARRTLDLLARRFPGNPVLMTVEIQHYSAQHRWEEAERYAEAQIAALAGDTLSLVDPFEALALMATTQGRLGEAERLWRTHLTLSAASGSMGRHHFGLLRRAGIELRYRNRPARALAMVDSALARTPLDSVLPGDRQYDELARFYAAAGRLERAHEMAAAADSNDQLLDRKLLADRGWTRGVIALAENRLPEAEALLRVAADQHQCTICVLPDLARAYEAAGKTQAATAVYERYVTTPWFWRYETDALELGAAIMRLAELYDAAGERAKAAAVRGRLLLLWRRADRELQPLVTEVRSKLATGER